MQNAISDFFVDELKTIMAQAVEQDDPIESMEDLIKRVAAKLEKVAKWIPCFEHKWECLSR